MNDNGLAINPSTQDLYELAYLHNELVARTGYLNLSTANPGSNGQGVQEVAQEPLIEPPPGSIPVEAMNGIVVPAVVVNTFSTVVSYTSPTGWDTAIKQYNVNITNPAFVDFQGDIVWQIAVDGRIIDGFGNITNQRGTVQQPRILACAIEVKSGQTITISASHNANGALVGFLVGGLFGYRYPRIG